MAVLGRHATVLLIALLCTCIRVATGDANKKKVYSICNGGVYRDNDLFTLSLREVLYHLRVDTAWNRYDYYPESPWPGPSPMCFGHGRCYGGLTRDECADCMTAAVTQIVEECPMRIGAQLQQVDCRARYEQYEFRE